jgi:ABC-type uncharacterized transport system permease subunit
MAISTNCLYQLHILCQNNSFRLIEFSDIDLDAHIGTAILNSSSFDQLILSGISPYTSTQTSLNYIALSSVGTYFLIRRASTVRIAPLAARCVNES